MRLRPIYLLALLAATPTGSPAQAPENPFSNESGETSGPETPARTSDAVPPKPGAKPDLLLRMTKKDCEKILRREDVPGADYVAGVDVRGNSVDGANLAGTLTAADILPDEIAFELALNPLTFAGNAALEETFANASASIGTVRFNLSSGALTLDGRRLNNETEQELIAICRQALGR